MTSIEMKPTSLSRSQGRFTWAGRPFQKAPAKTPKNKERFENIPPVPTTLFSNSDLDLFNHSEQITQSIKLASLEVKQSTKQVGRALKEKVNEIGEDLGLMPSDKRPRLKTSVVKPRGGADKRMLRLSFMYRNEAGVNQWLKDEDLGEELKKDAGPRNLYELNRLKACVNNLAIEYNSFLPPPHQDLRYGPNPSPRGVKRKPVPSSAMVEDGRLSADLDREMISSNQPTETTPLGPILMRQLSVAMSTDLEDKKEDEGSKSLDLAAWAASDIEKASHKHKSRRLSLSRKSSTSSLGSHHRFNLGDLPPTPTVPKVYSSRQKSLDSDPLSNDSPSSSGSSVASISESEEDDAKRKEHREKSKTTNRSIQIRSKSSSHLSNTDNSEDEDHQRFSDLFNRRQGFNNRKSNINVLSSQCSSAIPCRPPRRTRPSSISVIGRDNGPKSTSSPRPLGLESKDLEALNELLSPLNSGKHLAGPTPRADILEWTHNQTWKSESTQNGPFFPQLSPTTPRPIAIPTKVISSAVRVDSHPLSTTEEDTSSSAGDNDSVNSFSTSSLFSSSNDSSSNLSSHLYSGCSREESDLRVPRSWRNGKDLSREATGKRASISSESSILDHPAFSDKELFLES